jgi:uncharacterized DUF497 family protein
MAFTFEWDPQKATANARKHGVTFDEAATAFGDPFGLIVDDPRHSETEHRSVLLGYPQSGRLLAVMFTERGGPPSPHQRSDRDSSRTPPL